VSSLRTCGESRRWPRQHDRAKWWRRRRAPIRPRWKALRPAEHYLATGAGDARRLGHGYIGTEHVLLALTRDPESRAARILRRLGVTHADIRDSACLAELWAPRIDADALASLGVDLEAVRERLEERFGRRALEDTRAGMPEPTGGAIRCVAPRLKLALANALDRAGDQPVQDEHVLLGLLSIRDSLAARALAEVGVSLELAEPIVRESAQD
jgi:ATP-dependent Clp protease ATP-binding subunit ClpA